MGRIAVVPEDREETCEGDFIFLHGGKSDDPVHRVDRGFTTLWCDQGWNTVMPIRIGSGQLGQYLTADTA